MKVLFYLAVSFAISIMAPVSRGALVLEAKLENGWMPVVAVKEGKVFCQEGDHTVPVPEKTTWRLQGKLLDNTNMINWSPSYGIKVVQEMGQVPQLIGTVSLRHDLSSTYVRQGPSPFLKAWPKGLSHEGLVVAAWILDGEIRQIEVSPAPATTSKDVTIIDNHKFILSLQEAAGQAIHLLWMDGSFVETEPRFKDSHAQKAFEAMLVNDEARFSAELAQVENVNKPDERDQISLLHFAAEAGLVGAIDALVQLKAKLEAKIEPQGSRALHWAAANGRLAAVQRLLALKADGDPLDSENRTPLFRAVSGGHYETVLALVDCGGIDLESSSGVTPLATAINNDREDLARLLLSKKASRNFDWDQLERVLITKARNGNTAIVQLLLELGANANCRQEGTCPLIAAARTGTQAMATALLKGKATVNKTDDDGDTALMKAMLANNAVFAETLLENGAEVGSKDKQGRTSLHLAAYANAAKCAELLLAHGADLSVRDRKRCTPLETAVWAGSMDVAQLLLKKGASVSADSPVLAIEGVLRNDLSHVLKTMLESGYPAGTQLNGWPLIRVAELYKAAECIQVLKGFGVGTESDASPAIVPARGLDTAPTVLVNPMPDDPRGINSQLSEESVLVDIVIDREGQVQFPKIAKSNDASLSRAVLEILPNWRFSPPLKAGKPTAAKLRISVHFSASVKNLREQQIDEWPKALKRVEPRFPRKQTYANSPNVQKAIPGVVTIGFTLDKQGRTKDFRVIKTTSSEVSDAAIKALQQWTFTPARYKGQPVECRMEQSFQFSLTPE